MKSIILTKINAINLVIESIEENIRMLLLKINSIEPFVKNGHANYLIKLEYFQQAKKKNIERQKEAFEMLCKLN